MPPAKTPPLFSSTLFVSCMLLATGLQLDAAGAVAVPGHQSEAVDAGPAEPGAVLTRGQVVTSYAVVLCATTVRSAPRSTGCSAPHS